MVSSTPPIRPIQLSTLKALDPLDQKPQRGEDDNHQADIENILHGSSWRSGGVTAPDVTSMDLSEPRRSGHGPRPCGTHARRRGFLTNLMQRSSVARPLLRSVYGWRRSQLPATPGGAV